MLRLILVRHAKSAWTDPALADFDRPLSKRGRAAAGWIGTALAGYGVRPDRIVCSTARRTRETLDLALPALPPAAVVYAQQLYDLRDDDYLAFAAAEGGAATTLMLVGHNSATATTATTLASGRDRFLRNALLDFPTGGIAVFDLPIASWGALAPGVGRLTAFEAPPRD